MDITYQCPACRGTQRATVEPVDDATVSCCDCSWSRTVGASAFDGGRPARCLACGNEDLWRQKDFSQRLGVALVAAGALLSSIAWYYHHPLVALGILMGFALLDMILFWTMPDVLVCYRCQARHHRPPVSDSDESFNLELAERYRQEAIRLRQSEQHPV